MEWCTAQGSAIWGRLLVTGAGSASVTDAGNGGPGGPNGSGAIGAGLDGTAGRVNLTAV